MPSAKNSRKARCGGLEPAKIKTKLLKHKKLTIHIKRLEKKMEKLLKLRKEGKKRKNCILKTKEGVKVIESKHIRYQGFSEESQRHKNMKSHIQRLRNILN